MIIIVLGMMFTVGITQTSLFGTMNSMNTKTSEFAENIQAVNIAHEAAEVVLFELRQNPAWRVQNHTLTVSQGDALISINEIHSDTLQIISNGLFEDQFHTVEYTVVETRLAVDVPEFSGAMTIDTDNFIFSLGGAAEINGNDVSGTCPATPGVGVSSLTSELLVGFNSRIKGNPDGKAGMVPGGSYNKAQDLIRNLEESPFAHHITETNYKGDLGTEEEPGVFFIDQKVRLSGGIPEGYGILVIRAGGELELDGSLDLAGNFKFNGLVIFENAYNLDAKGTPTINGSILIGSNDGSTIPIHISGDVQFNYDCTAQDYANLAAQNTATNNRRYTAISIFE